MTKILILYYSKHGNTGKMARLIGRGVEAVNNCEAVIRRVPETTGPAAETESDQGDLLVSREDLRDCDGLIIGSPARFGNMAAPLKTFIDETGAEWFSGTLSGKPAAVFTSSSSLHGGQETTLLTMMLPLLHHGMVIVGLPYSEPALLDTASGGTPYGPSHWSGNDSERAIDAGEKSLCLALGQRVADMARRLKSTPGE